MPPTPSKGRMATASTMIPIPPSQFRVWRHRLIDGANVSRPTITVAPVVVRPDMVSKKASVNDSDSCQDPGSWSIRGTVAMAAMRVQAMATRMKPSLALSSVRWRRVARSSRSPASTQAARLTRKVSRVPSR